MFPDGIFKGREFLIGDIHGNKGESLKIHTDGSKTGYWCDFSEDGLKGRSLVSLWRAARNLNYPDTKREIMDFLGVKDTFKHTRIDKIYKKPRANITKQSETDKSPAIKYLTEERKILPEVCKLLGIKDSQKDAGVCYERREGNEVVGMKFIAFKLDDKGKKQIMQVPGCKPCLYGKDAVDGRTDALDELLICEGEIDCLSWWSMGVPAVSVSQGCADLQWIDIDWEWLEQFTTIYISFDMDEEGQKPLREICDRLGLARVRVVNLTKNDFNDHLIAGITKEETQKLLDDAEFCNIEEIKPAGAFDTTSWEYFYPTSTAMEGFNTPWNTLPFKIRNPLLIL